MTLVDAIDSLRGDAGTEDEKSFWVALVITVSLVIIMTLLCCCWHLTFGAAARKQRRQRPQQSSHVDGEGGIIHDGQTEQDEDDADELNDGENVQGDEEKVEGGDTGLATA